MRLRRVLWIAGLLLLGALLWLLWQHRWGVPEDFDHMEGQFKYGSIGADHPLAQAPLPYWLWKVLPEIFPPSQVIPNGWGPKNTLRSYEAFGLVQEKSPDKPSGWAAGQIAFERPIGVSKRRVLGMDFVGLNCAFCHLGVMTPKPGAPPQVILGGVGNTVDIEAYFLFLFSAMTSEEFTAGRVMPAIDRELKRQGAELPWWQRALYRFVLIPVLPSYLKGMEQNKFDFIVPNNPARLPEFGPGRVDTWSLYKRTFVSPPQHDSIAGTSDFPSLWNQKARVGMRLHWDGNTDVLIERNVISALSLIGARIEALDFQRLSRTTEWIVDLLPPRYADRVPDGVFPPGRPAIDMALADRGSALFADHCAQCHAPTGLRTGRVEPIEDLGTDPRRFQSFTPELQNALNQLGTDQWQLRNFRVQTGYVNMLLDGLWLRAPYLHNGSVPTLHDLLEEPAKRPQQFCRGGSLYDWVKLGYVSATTPDAQGKPSCPTGFLYDTRTPGNNNSGHFYGTTLAAADKEALLEFLKTQ